MQYHRTIALAAIAVIHFSDVSAALAAPDDDQFSVYAGVEGRSVKNVNLATDSALEVDEFQTDVEISANGMLQGGWSFLQTNGSFESRTSSELKERDQQIFVGEALFHLGKSTSPLALELEYMGEEVAIDPTLGDTPFNLDSREVVSAALISQGRLGRATILSARAELSQIEFDEFVENDSDRTSLLLGITRNVSPTFQTGFSLTSQTIEYTSNDSEIELMSLIWASDWTLRNRSYGVAIGQDKLSREGEDTQSPNVKLYFNTNAGTQTFNVELRQWLTDTSMGDGNSTDFAEGVSQDGRLGVIDQFVNRQGSIGWSSGFLCSRCEVSLGVLLHEEEYEQFSEFDSSETKTSLSVKYRVSPTWALFAKYSGSSMTFNDFSEQDYKEGLVEAGVNSNYIKGVTLGGVFRQLSRSFEGGALDYETGYIGLSVRYELYKR